MLLFSKMDIEDFYTEFPLVFQQKPPCGFYVGKGWLPMLKTLCQKIETILAEQPEDQRDFRMAQVKSKFGGLRFYYDYMQPRDEEAAKCIDELVHKAENDSYKTCSVCGVPGTPREWGNVRCDACEKDKRIGDELDQRTEIIWTRARKNADDWYDLSDEVRQERFKEAESQLISEGGIQSVEKTRSRISDIE